MAGLYGLEIAVDDRHWRHAAVECAMAAVQTLDGAPAEAEAQADLAAAVGPEGQR